MEAYKLKVKIGAAEFEAEGPEEAVKAQFEQFKQILGEMRMVVPGVRVQGTGTVTQPELPGAPPPTVDNAGLERLFAMDEKDDKKSVSLRFLPQGDDRDTVAVVLLLLGHERLVGEQRVRVTTLKEALERSGLTLARVDRIADKALRQGLVLKGGKAKGGTYALSNTGRARAAQETQRMLEQA